MLVITALGEGVGNGSLKVDDADKGYASRPKEREQLR